MNHVAQLNRISTIILLGLGAVSCVSNPQQTNSPVYKNTGQQSGNNTSVYKNNPLSSDVLVGSNLTNKEQKNILRYHNKVRKNVKVPALTWSPKLAKYAQKWARTIKNQNCSLSHSHSEYGENLFKANKKYKVVDAAKSWEKEKKYYLREPLNQNNVQRAGHYTQMVWRNTTKLGCAKTMCGNEILVVCNYDPAGNYLGRKAY